MDPYISNLPVHSSYFPILGKLHQLFQYILVFTMTDSLIPLASDAIYWGEQLFDLVAPVTMTEEKFEEIWPLVSCVYSHRKTEKRFKGTVKVSHYGCRLRKSRKSSNARADNPEGTNLKRRPCSTNREAGICNVTMKITREIEGKKTVTIERIEKLGKDSNSSDGRHRTRNGVLIE